MQAKMLGTGDEQTHNARSGSKLSGTRGTFICFAPNFLWNLPFIFLKHKTSIAKREHFSAFKRRVAVRTKATSLDGCVAL
jgi:hypothetical protein